MYKQWKILELIAIIILEDKEKCILKNASNHFLFDILITAKII